MKLHRFILGDLAVNSYLFWEEESKEAICIDPGGPLTEILSQLNEERLKLVNIILTHGHADHILGVAELKAKTGAPVSIHAGDAAMLANPVINLSHLFGWNIVIKPDRLLAEGDTICVGTSLVSVLHTPGHTPGGICLLTQGIAFTGDTLFAGSIGRTDLPGGDQETLLYSVSKLLSLADDTRVFPGHGPESTIGRERDTNPFLRQPKER